MSIEKIYEKYCMDGCCKLLSQEYITNYSSNRRSRNKSGMIIYDPDADQLLLVQSRGNCWGPPKGTKNSSETYIECALREVKEETGLLFSSQTRYRRIYIRSNVVFYYTEMEKCDVNVQDHIPCNDANGITWIRPTCLYKMVMNGDICINWYCRRILQLMFKIKIKNKSSDKYTNEYSKTITGNLLNTDGIEVITEEDRSI